MYILDEQLISRIQRIAEEAADRSNRTLAFEEYIALPYFGQIILRFSFNRDACTLLDLDMWENVLYEIVGDEFLIDFMGSVYKRVGVNYARIEERFAELSRQLEGEAIPPSIHSPGLRMDAECLLKTVGLPLDKKVWEIQPDGKEWVLLVMGKQAGRLKEVDAFVRLHVGEVSEESCLGLIRAAFYAKRKRVSLAKVLMSEQDEKR